MKNKKKITKKDEHKHDWVIIETILKYDIFKTTKLKCSICNEEKEELEHN